VLRRRALGFDLKIQRVSLEGDDPEGARGVDLLGVPIGTDQYVERALQHGLERTQRELEAIEQLPRQHRLLILRCCIVCEINFWCRTSTPQQNRVAIADIERRMSTVLRRAMHLAAEGDPPINMIGQCDEVMFHPELSTNETLRLHATKLDFRGIVSRCMLGLPMSKGGAKVHMVFHSRPHAFVAGMMDVLNSKLGGLTHFGHHLRSAGVTGTVMGPNVFNELATAIGKLRNNCAGATDKADDPLPQSIYDMLRNHSEDRFTGRPGQACQQHIG